MKKLATGSSNADARRRIQEITCKPFGLDPTLDAWADTLLSAAEAFVRNKSPDPLDGFTCNYWR
jgi:hypothetical protein